MKESVGYVCFLPANLATAGTRFIFHQELKCPFCSDLQVVCRKKTNTNINPTGFYLAVNTKTDWSKFHKYLDSAFVLLAKAFFLVARFADRLPNMEFLDSKYNSGFNGRNARNYLFFRTLLSLIPRVDISRPKCLAKYAKGHKAPRLIVFSFKKRLENQFVIN